jgi:hypothetical protein
VLEKKPRNLEIETSNKERIHLVIEPGNSVVMQVRKINSPR